MLTKIASAIYNDLMAGLAGYTSSPTISLQQLEDDVVDERLQIIKEYAMHSMIPRKDLMMSINCIPVDCKSLDKCPCDGPVYSEPVAHFEIPQTINVTGMFKDPRQVAEYDCCAADDLENYTFITAEIKKRLTEKKLRYYRQMYIWPQPNNQSAK